MPVDLKINNGYRKGLGPSRGYLGFSQEGIWRLYPETASLVDARELRVGFPISISWILVSYS
jgi:hypothetical protein